MTARRRVLIVEDDAKLAGLVREFLEQNGFEVSVELGGARAAERILAEQPDVVLLDVMLPDQDGLSICRRVRPAFAGAIVMLTALGEEVDEVVGLELGADDYLAKPVRPRLLLARVNSLLRRVAGEPGQRRPVVVGSLVVDPSSRTATVGGRAVELTTAEFDLLLLLASRAGQVVSREEIYTELRGIAYDGLDRSIDLRIARLRRKLGDDGRSPRKIKSVRGAGYMLAVDP